MRRNLLSLRSPPQVMHQIVPLRAPYRGSQTDLIVSLDLGLTYSGASWVLLDPGEVPQIWDVSEYREGFPFAKVPTVLYYDRKGDLQAAGSDALDPSTIYAAKQQQWTRVDWFKLLLCPPYLSDIQNMIPMTNMPPNKNLAAIIADFLRYMANLVGKHFHYMMDEDGDIWKEVKDRVSYILSHPNGWNTFQHPLIRDAAILAGLIPDSDEGKNRIIFVSEGEASLYWCISKGFDRYLQVGNQLIVVDAGGGTIDISSFKTVCHKPLELEESSIPECHLQGSAFVTKAFREFLQEKLKGSSFNDPEMIERMVEHFDRQVKCNFRDREQDMLVRFGGSQDNDPRFGIDAGELLVRGEEMAKFFEPACSAIVASVNANVAPDHRTTVVLVGGLTLNQYVFRTVCHRLSHCSVYRPRDTIVKASAHGMIHFYLNCIVTARMAQWTYGVSCFHDFDPNDPKHAQRKSRVRTNSVTSKPHLEGGFHVTIPKGTVVRETELTRFPIWHSQTERPPKTLNIWLECYRGDVLDIKFRDEDIEEQFQDLCLFKVVIPETSLVRRVRKVKTGNPLLRSRQYYYVSNLWIAVSFGATEFKFFIEWEDEKGRTQRGPITPIWNTQLHPVVDSIYHHPNISPGMTDETSTIDSSQSARLSQLSLLSVTTMESEFTVVPCQQRDRERLPLLAQPRTLSGGSIKLDVTPLTNAAPHRMQSSDAWDMLVLGVEHGGLNVGSVRSPLPWEGGIKDFQFINSQCACTPDLIGAFGDWVVSASSTLLLFTLSSRVIIYDIVRKKSREIHYGFHVKSTSSVAHTLSPDGKTLVRWMFDEENQDSTLLVIDVRAKDQIAQSRRSYQCQQHDILYARWIDESTIYIPISAEGIIIRWIIRDSAPQDGLENSSVRPGDLTVIQPSESITRHSILKLDVTKDGAWWTASGITLSDPPSGHIQAHHVETEESSFLKGLASCIAVADVHDKERVLLVSAGITPDFQLQFHVEQLDSEDSGHPFMTVDVDVDLIEEKDYPTDIIALHPLPIVAVMTEKSYSYFFELHSGAYLYSQAHKSYRFCPGQSAKRELLLWSHEKSDVQALSIKEDDLIRYCRKVLKDDSLAEAIASRTGHRGAKDIILDDM